MSEALKSTSPAL